MGCSNSTNINGLNSLNGATVYRGETIIGDFTLYDDNNNVVTSVDDAVVLFSDSSRQHQCKSSLLVLRIDDGMSFDNGNFRFVVSPEQSDKFPDNVTMEVKVVVNGVTRIAMRNIMTMVDNTVKKY